MILKAIMALILSVNLTGNISTVGLELVNPDNNEIQIDQVAGPRKTSHSLGVEVGATSALVLDMGTGKILFDKASNEKISMASLTKMMTAIVTLESGAKLDDKVLVDGDALRFYGAGIGLEMGEEVTVSDLLHGLLINSGNDTAMALAKHVGGSIEGFVKLMNEKAKQLGMINTRFKNPHGLDANGHQSTASDMAIMVSHYYKNATVRKIIVKKDYAFDSLNGTKHHQFKSTNMLLREDYPYMVGAKTGFTDNAGYCLASIERDEYGHEIVVIVLGNPEDGGHFHDTKALTEWTFRNYSWGD